MIKEIKIYMIYNVIGEVICIDVSIRKNAALVFRNKPETRFFN